MATKPASVLITGANRGLGLEMVKQMVERYHSLGILFACCRDPDRPKAEGLKTLASKYPNIITVLHLDVTDLCSIKTAAQQVGSLVGTGGLNLLINNAGILLRGNLQDTSPEDMHTSFNTNVVGPMNIIKEFQPLLKTAAKASGIPGMSSKKAAVINIGALLGALESVPYSYTFLPALSYRISKAGMNMLTLCASEELKKDGVLFSVLHPGWVRTDMGGPMSYMSLYLNPRDCSCPPYLQFPT
uniref:Uncharacterized protein n=1 Tax=Monopterus albus TaxID=43700 RepID=A0A3Q3IGC6_MONAL|nr:uncharacterized protein LOC109965922 isoform X2 [Monopterus albus]